MEKGSKGGGSQWLRVIAIMLIGLAVIGPGFGRGVAAHEDPDDRPLDLAAMALRPADLESVGLEGYGSDLGELMTAEQQIADFVERVGGDPDEFSEVLIDDAGLQGSYWMRIGLPVDPGNFDTIATRSVIVTLYAFADVQGATDGYDYLLADPDPAEEGETEFTPVDADVSVGDESDLVSFETEAVENGDPIQAMNLFFRSGPIVVDLIVMDIRREGERADDPDVDEITDLGEVLVDRIGAAIDGDAPGLSGEIVRLADDDGEMDTKLDIYTTVDGETVRRFNESEDETAARQERYDDAGIVDVYGVEQSVQLGSAESTADPYYSARVFRFEDEAAAEEWLDEDAFNGIANDPSITEFDRIRRVDQLGDGTAAATYSAEIDGTEFFGRIVAVRSGDLVAVVRMESGHGVNLDTVMEVVEIQLDCLEAGTCDGPVAPPDGFIPS